jgi:hypothetical protein
MVRPGVCRAPHPSPFAARLPCPQDLNAAVISLTAEVDQAVISAVRKDQLRGALKTLKKKFDDWEKAKKANQEKLVRFTLFCICVVSSRILPD